MLIVPIAQTAATWHMLSHLHSELLDRGDGRPAIQQDRCDLCLSAAALVGGAPLVSSSHLTPVAVRHAPPAVAPNGILFLALMRAYNSRAPPLSPALILPS